MSKLRFEVEHYGTLVNSVDFETKKAFVTFKKFLYNGKHYVELWKNGKCVCFLGE